ncbi:MAG: aspartyl protease family protein [Blastocatellia bacterium]
MSHQLNFQLLHEYDVGRPGIPVPVTLQMGGAGVMADAYVDSGSVRCFFSRVVGERLGLSIEDGQPETFSTAGGPVKGYGHFVTLESLGFRFDVMVFFAANHGFKRNLLGRIGWLDRLQIGLVDYEGKLFLGEYQGE